jgi:hypothetical protein
MIFLEKEKRHYFMRKIQKDGIIGKVDIDKMKYKKGK